MKQKILAFGVKKLDVPDPHLYFQGPGGQVFKLVGINEDPRCMRGHFRQDQERPRRHRTCVNQNVRSETSKDQVRRGQKKDVRFGALQPSLEWK